MIDILEHLKCLYPILYIKVSVPGEDKTQDKFYATTQLGGDYLTVAHMRVVQQIRCTPNFEEDRLNSFFPCN